MRRALLAYHTSEGQTAKVGARIAQILRTNDIDVEVAEAEIAPDPTPFDLVVLGDSIHVSRHSRQLTGYVARYMPVLNTKPVALFQVSLSSAADDEAHSTEAVGMLHRLLDTTGLDPDLVGLFAGALVYTRYGWFKRHLMASIAKREFGEAHPDLSTDREYTDWEAVEEFAAHAAALLDPTST